MEKEKNNKFIIGLVVGIILILVVVIILFATGIISFSSKDNNSNDNTTIKTIKADSAKDYVYAANYQAETKYQEHGKNCADELCTQKTREGFDVTVIKEGKSFFKDLTVPYININTIEAININDSLKQLYNEYVQKYNSANDACKTDSKDVCPAYMLTYRTYQYNNILSIVVMHGTLGEDIIHPEYLVYNFDLTDGNLLNYNQFLTKYNITSNDTTTKANEKITSLVNQLNDGNNQTYIDNSINKFKKDIEENKVLFFTDNQGNINYIVTIYMNAGNGYDPRLITLN